MEVFVELEQKNQFVWKYERLQIAKENKKKKIRRLKYGDEEFRVLDFRLHKKATLIKIVWYWSKNRNIDQWNRIESLEINPHMCDHLIYDKGDKDIQ